MREELMIAGIGGQGILTMGQVVCVAAMREGKNVSWYPDYSPEVRGGRSYCTVVVADGEVGSPVVGRPANLVVMHPEFVAHTVALVAPGGRVILNSSLVHEPLSRTDLHVLAVPADELGRAAGHPLAGNMAVIAAFAALTGVVSIEALREAIRETAGPRHQHHVPVNIKAAEFGAEFARNLAAEVLAR